MYTYKPEQKHAKAYGRNLRISRKAAVKICRVIRNKPLKRSKRLLENLVSGKQSLGGKYYTKSSREILELVESCEKNASDLDNEKLFVHASAHEGSVIRRRRRKAGYGSRMKSTNIEIILIEKGKEKTKQKPAEKPKEKKKPEPAEPKKVEKPAEQKKQTAPIEKPAAPEKKESDKK